MVFGWKRKRVVPEIRFLSLEAGDDMPREFRLLKSDILIGSGEDNQFVIRRPSVSRRHASVAFRKDHYEISDLGSTNGTFVNGRRIAGPIAFDVGDELRVGDANFVVAKPAGTASQSPKTTKKAFTLRGAVEAMVLAFAVGFGAAQYLAYLFYHEQNRLILAGAVPINQGENGPVATNTGSQLRNPIPPAKGEAQPAPTAGQAMSETEAELSTQPKKNGSNRQAQPEATPAQVAELPRVRPPSMSSKPEGIGGKEFGGGVALARLIVGSGSEAGRMAPNFELTALDGSQFSLGSIRGKVVLLNFWATWCGACRSEMPALEGLYKDFRSNSDFALVTVSVSGHGAGPVTQFMQRNGYDFPVLVDDTNATSSQYGVSGIPSTFVIGRDGQIVWNCVGAIDWSNPVLRGALKKLL